MTESEARRIQDDVHRHFGHDAAFSYWGFIELAFGVRIQLEEHEQVALTAGEFELVDRLRCHLGISLQDVGSRYVHLTTYVAENSRRNLATVVTREDIAVFEEMEAAVSKAIDEKRDQRFQKNLVGRVAREFTELRPMETVEGQEAGARRAVARCFEEVSAIAAEWRPSIVLRHGETRHERFEEALPGLLSAMADALGVTMAVDGQIART